MQRARGALGRHPQQGEAIIFRWPEENDPQRHELQTLTYPRPLRGLWLQNGTVVHAQTLPAFRGYASGVCDRAVEVSAGTPVDVGDTVIIQR